ncbi:hypothetical protein ACL02U_04600 [Streptomyces sp. MS06]|uniref:hypothetical protein n=1 Tax=Streptomyces sp. MS06 TaxID=3385974 RepID=UPI0039A05701
MHVGLRKATKSLVDQTAVSIATIRELAGDLVDALQALSQGRAPHIDELTMPDVVRFFVESKGAVPDAAAAAVLRHHEGSAAQSAGEGRGPDEYLVHLFFLDDAGRPLIEGDQPWRSYLTQSFDGELARAFGGNNVVIFN